MPTNNIELQQRNNIASKYIYITPVIIGVILIVARIINPLLFHTLAELFAIFVAFLMSIVAWHTYHFSKNNYLMFLGCGYLWIGALDAGHMLTYSGLGIFAFNDPNVTLEFWIVARFYESLLLLSAPLFLKKNLNRHFYLLVFAVASVVATLLVMFDKFPVMYIPDSGLTHFKVYSEYVIILLLVLAILHTAKWRHFIDNTIFRYMVASIACTAVAEYSFTLYIGFFDISTVVGHILKFISYWLIYIAIVRTTLIEPFNLMARGASTYDAINDPVIVVDRDGLIHELNRAAVEATGKSEQELVGQSCHKYFHDKSISEDECQLCKKISIGQAPDVFLIKHINNMDWTEVRLSPIKTGKNIEGYVHVSHNVTDTKKMEEAVQESERQLASMLASIRDVIFRTDSEDRIIWTSPSIYQLTGYSYNEIIGKPICYLIINNTRFVEMARILESNYGNVVNFELELRKKDRKKIIASINAQYYYDDQGNVLGIEGSMHDITNLKAAEERLIKSERRYKSLVENLPIKYFLYSIDKNGNYVYVSPSVTQVLGYKQRDFLQYHDTYMTDNPVNRIKQQNRISILKDENAEPYEIEYMNSDGQTCLMELSESLVKDEHGQVIGIDGIAHDITDKKRIEIETEQLHRQLQQAQKMEAIGQLTGGIAHDFNNILASILGYADLARERFAEDKEGKLHAYLTEIHTAGGRARDLIAQMLAYSRGGSSNPRPHQIEPLVKEVTKLLQSTIPSSISVNYEFEKNLPKMIFDPVQIHQVIMNLCINSRDAMEGHGQIVIHVFKDSVSDAHCDSCHKSVTGEYMVIEVRDTGPGITSEVKQRMFDPFFSTKETGQGTGMGLSVVHGIVHEHQGHILVDSDSGTGTTFKLYFPIKAIDSEVIETSTLPEPVKHGHGHILIVDDDESVAGFFAEYLESHGYEATTFYDPVSAIEQFAREPSKYDLVVTDQVMPEINGDELSEILLSRRPDLPIILCSGYSEYQHDESSTQQGRVQYLSKPVEGEKLLKVINESLKKQRNQAR
ncbi:MAG: MASE3 domain-containing protein [Thioalkalispiraceae bacterium]|jgi:PAS domain S-box-containing protein